MEDNFLEQTKPLEDEPLLYQVLEHTGELWQVGSPMPIDNDKDHKVIRLLENEDLSVDAYVLPLVGTTADQGKRAFIHNLRPMAIKRTNTVARFDVWKEMLVEALDSGEEPPPEEKKQEVNGIAAQANGTV